MPLRATELLFNSDDFSCTNSNLYTCIPKSKTQAKLQITPKSIVSVDSLRMLSFPLFLSSLFTSSKVSMLEMERPAINFLAVKLWNFAERSAMLPRSARLGWSGLAQSGLSVETEEDLERSDMLSS